MKIRHKYLNRECRKVTGIRDIEYLKENLIRFYDLLEEEKGIGLAANQVGLNLQFCVTKETDKILRYYINPVIVEKSDSTIDITEGCLSLPNQSYTMKRHTKIVIMYENFDGDIQIAVKRGLDAIILQHEIDHLYGFTIKDRCNNEANRSDN